ncbi:MAG: hypothetical protein RID91_03045 [Azospirillaceae bacterium]
MPLIGAGAWLLRRLHRTARRFAEAPKEDIAGFARRRLDRMDAFTASPVRMWSFAISIAIELVPSSIVALTMVVYPWPSGLYSGTMAALFCAFMFLMLWYVGRMSAFFMRLAEPGEEYARLRARVDDRLKAADAPEEVAELRALHAELGRRLRADQRS